MRIGLTQCLTLKINDNVVVKKRLQKTNKAFTIHVKNCDQFIFVGSYE